MTIPMRDMKFDIRGTDKSQAAFDSASRRARAFNGEINKTQAAIGAASAAAKSFMAVFAAGAVVAFAGKIRDVVGEASELAKIADKVGVTTNELQRLQFGFGQAGVAASDMERNLEQWSKRLSEANSYGGRLADILEVNGIRLRDGNGVMRSSIDLLRDYANLIQNAGSSQEQMTLATEAFGRSGGDMILALRGGAAGVRELMDRADDAGGVIDEQLLRKAEALDDRFDTWSRTLSINVKSAMLDFVISADEMRAAMGGLDDHLSKVNASIFNFLSMGFTDEIAAFGLKQAGMLQPISGAEVATNQLKVFGNELGAVSRKIEQDNIQNRIDGAFSGARKTIIPETKSTRKSGSGSSSASKAAREAQAAAREAEKQVLAYNRVTQALDDELAALGMNATEQRVMQEIRRAGVEAGSAQAEQISRRVALIDEERAAYEQAAAASEFFGQQLQDSVLNAIPAIQTGNDALDDFLNTMIKVAAQSVLFGTGPLGGLFGGGIFSSLIPGRALGGSVDAGKAHWVGETGRELFIPGTGGTIVPANDLTSARSGGAPRGGDIIYAPVNTFTGTSSELEQFQRQYEKDKAAFPAKVLDTIGNLKKTRALR